jgi:hypothetical protein
MRMLFRAVILAIGLASAFWLATVWAAQKVTICHSGNGKHYETIVVDDDSNQIKGHCNHSFDCRGSFDKTAIDLCSSMPPCAAGFCVASPARH